MLKKRNISEDEAIKIACKKNGLKYNANSNKDFKFIIEGEDGIIRQINSKYEVTPIGFNTALAHSIHVEPSVLKTDATSKPQQKVYLQPPMYLAKRKSTRKKKPV